MPKRKGHYRSWRDFRRPPRTGKSREWRKKGNPFFVIQQHDASTLHYDFRLEVKGVLRSWAIPKGPSTDPRDKRLAVQVEDHPIDYADFEGVIAEGQYGSGAVVVWDAGPYLNLKTDEHGKPVPMSKSIDQGTVEIWLEGKKIRGGYALVRTRLGGKAENWLLIKMKDDEADARRKPVASEPESVLTGRTLAEVAEQEGGLEAER